MLIQTHECLYPRQYHAYEKQVSGSIEGTQDQCLNILYKALVTLVQKLIFRICTYLENSIREVLIFDILIHSDS